MSYIDCQINTKQKNFDTNYIILEQLSLLMKNVFDELIINNEFI